MSKFVQVCCLGLALVSFGCGGSTPELGAAKETPQMSQDEINKKMNESFEKQKASGHGTQIEAPGSSK